MIKFFYITLLFIVTSQINAQEIQPSTEYRGETTLKSTPYGITFILPSGWTGIYPADSDFFIMKNTNFEGYIFIAINKMTIASAKEIMSRPIDLGDGVVFHPRAPVKTQGSTLVAEYNVSGSKHPLSGTIKTIVGDYGQGISFIAASPVKDQDKIQADLNKITTHLKLSDPKKSKAPSTIKGNSPWFEHLNGRKLSHFYTATGYTEEDYIWLCNSGYFYKSSNSGGFGGGASGAFQSGNGGRWSVSGTLQKGTLLLTYNDGSTASYTLTHEGTKIFLDGKRYFRERISCK